MSRVKFRKSCVATARLVTKRPAVQPGTEREKARSYEERPEKDNPSVSFGSTVRSGAE